MTDTRDQFLQAARDAFAARGFYGTSIAHIVESLPFTKQALLHHFGSKEKLYGEVLQRISERLMRELDTVAAAHSKPDRRFEETFIAFFESARSHAADTHLLMRELLDNQRRAETARNWYLQTFLERLTRMAQAVPDMQFDNKQAALAFVYQLLGAINYFVVSAPTLQSMFGQRSHARLQRQFATELKRFMQVAAPLSSG
ncbi:MAG: TetR/AcrR family transcriptional regulator [Pseudomonadota bacterium]